MSKREPKIRRELRRLAGKQCKTCTGVTRMTHDPLGIELTHAAGCPAGAEAQGSSEPVDVTTERWVWAPRGQGDGVATDQREPRAGTPQSPSPSPARSNERSRER